MREQLLSKPSTVFMEQLSSPGLLQFLDTSYTLNLDLPQMTTQQRAVQSAATAINGQMMDAIKVGEGPHATSLPRKKRKHNEEQTKAVDLGKFTMTSSFAGKLLQAVFVNSEKSR